MHSLGSRANAIFAYTSFVVGGLLFLNILTAKLLLEPKEIPKFDLALDRVEKLYDPTYILD
jgi:hypothetical protein